MKNLILSLFVLVLPLKAMAQNSSSTSTNRMVVGGSALTALTLEGLIRANSFNFNLGNWNAEYDASRSLNDVIRTKRYGPTALTHARSVTLTVRFTTARDAWSYTLVPMMQESVDLARAAESTNSPAEKIRLTRLYQQKNAQWKALFEAGPMQERFTRGLPRSVEYTIPNSKFDILSEKGSSLSLRYGSGDVTKVRILTVLHNQRILRVMRYARNGTVAVAAITAAGLLAAEEGASALTYARRNRELAEMMTNQN